MMMMMMMKRVPGVTCTKGVAAADGVVVGYATGWVGVGLVTGLV